MNTVKGWSIRLITATILLSLCSCRTAQPVPTELQTKAITEEIRKVHTAITEAAGRADVEMMFRCVAENGNAIFMNDGKQLLTRKQAYEFYKEQYKSIQKVEYQFSRQDVTVISPQTALWIERGRANATTTDGRTFETSFNQTIVFVLTKDDWKALYVHASDNRN